MKVNVVLMKNVNDIHLPAFLNWIKDRPIQLRFIELMETGDGSDVFRGFHISGNVIRARLLQAGWELVARAR